jgi:hypothetical protein
MLWLDSHARHTVHREALANSLWIILIAAPVASQAQRPDERYVVLESLKDTEWVRVATPALGRREGRVLDWSASGLLLSPEPPQPIRVPATTIDTLWTRGTSVKAGAVAGALIGAALGVALGSGWCDREDDCDASQMQPRLGGVGLGAGALVGTLFGLGIPKWHRRYP